MKITISDTEKELIKSLIGTKLVSVSGPNLVTVKPSAFGQMMMADFVLINTEKSSVAIRGVVTEETIGDLTDEFAHFEIKPGLPSELKTSRDNGFVYTLHSGEIIERIWLTSETLQGSGRAAPPWTLTTDVAIKIELGGCLIAVSKGSHNNEILKVSYSPMNSMNEVPNVSGRFEEDSNNIISRKWNVVRL